MSNYILAVSEANPPTKTRSVGVTLCTLLVLVFLSACNYPGGIGGQDQRSDQSATQAASTVSAQLTEVAKKLGETQQPLPTLVPPTVVPTFSPTPTQVPPTHLPPTATPYPCNWAAFVTDVTIPDGHVMRPGNEFEKTWRLKNIGSCSWSNRYDLIYGGGQRMGGERAVSLGGTIRPGEKVDVSVELTAPKDSGEYVGYWALRDDVGRVFGLGSKAEGVFWVMIRVERLAELVYDFTNRYCDADWRGATGYLACPGDPSDAEGFVLRLEEPLLEGGRQENEPGLWTQPQAEKGAWVTGEFPAFDVEKGDEFRAVLACLSDSEDCDVRFRLEYRLEDGAVRTLKKWDEESDGEFQKVTADLSDLAGKKVDFILTVRANGSSDQNAALWLAPGIWR